MISSLQKWIFRSVIVLFWAMVMVAAVWFSSIPLFLKNEQSITIFIWPKMMDPEYIAQFEKEAGIKVYVSYFTNNEELLSKMRATGGKGYDLIVPSDYAMEWLLNDKLIQKLDTKKIDAFKDLNPRLLHHYFDPKNEYSVPYFWAVYGLGVNKEFFEGKALNDSWALIFDKSKIQYPIGMNDVPREVILMVAQYLYGDINAVQDPANREMILRLLIAQKKWVNVYNDARSDDLLISRAAAVVTGMSSEIWRVAREDKSLAFVQPKEGGFLVIDSLAIPAKSTKQELVYKFINFMYQESVVVYHMEKYGVYPARILSAEQQKMVHMPTAQQFERLSFFKNVVPEEIFNDMWVRLMAY